MPAQVCPVQTLIAIKDCIDKAENALHEACSDASIATDNHCYDCEKDLKNKVYVIIHMKKIHSLSKEIDNNLLLPVLRKCFYCVYK